MIIYLDNLIIFCLEKFSMIYDECFIIDFNIKIILKNIGYMELIFSKFVLYSEINVIDN